MTHERLQALLRRHVGRLLEYAAPQPVVNVLAVLTGSAASVATRDVRTMVAVGSMTFAAIHNADTDDLVAALRCLRAELQDIRAARRRAREFVHTALDRLVTHRITEFGRFAEELMREERACELIREELLGGRAK